MKKLSFMSALIFLLIILFSACDMQSNEKNKTPKETKLNAIYISQTPTKLKYAYDEQLDLTGLVVKAIYSDGAEKTVDGWTSSPKPWTNLRTSGTVSVTISYQDKTAAFTVSVASQKTEAVADRYFWGVWVRMDNGNEYEVLEDSVIQGSRNFNITDSTSSKLTVASLGTFTKESDRVMVDNNNIPYFRKGGANLEYKLKLVSFDSGTDRALGTAISGIQGKAKSKKYKNFETESESDAEGQLKFTAPTVNDTQEITIINGDEIVVVPGLNIINNGDYMGTIALVGKDDYNLKITGTISDDQKDNGYLYGNNAKSYKMTVTITNISQKICTASTCKIESIDPSHLFISSASESIDISGFTIVSLPKEAAKSVELMLEYGDLSEPYIDTGLTVTIKNPNTNKEWIDYIPLRFFRETIPITISAKNDDNKNASLNGFVIYPDGNNQFFSIKNDSNKTVYVPTFGSDKEYLLVFSGAKATTQVSGNTEMFYTVAPGSLVPKPVVTKGYDDIGGFISFGGNNHSEKTAYPVTKDFEAYLIASEIDYYSITADSMGY